MLRDHLEGAALCALAVSIALVWFWIGGEFSR